METVLAIVIVIILLLIVGIGLIYWKESFYLGPRRAKKLYEELPEHTWKVSFRVAPGNRLYSQREIHYDFNQTPGGLVIQMRDFNMRRFEKLMARAQLRPDGIYLQYNDSRTYSMPGIPLIISWRRKKPIVLINLLGTQIWRPLKKLRKRRIVYT